MRYKSLACDYDGTLAGKNGSVADKAVAALRRFKDSGRKLLLVTGRELGALRQVFPHCDVFERIVAENGAVLYRADTGETRVLGTPPPQPLLDVLRQKGVQPLSVGRVILATREPHETTVLEAIHDLGLEYQIIFNKGAVMVLPSGVNKATGLKAALKELGLSGAEAAGIGDAENDHAFLELCGFSVAVANALPTLKAHVDFVTGAENGGGGGIDREGSGWFGLAGTTQFNGGTKRSERTDT